MSAEKKLATVAFLVAQVQIYSKYDETASAEFLWMPGSLCSLSLSTHSVVYLVNQVLSVLTVRFVIKICTEWVIFLFYFFTESLAFAASTSVNLHSPVF